MDKEQKLWSALLVENGFDEEDASAIVKNYSLAWIAYVVADAYVFNSKEARKDWIAMDLCGRGERLLWELLEIEHKEDGSLYEP